MTEHVTNGAAASAGSAGENAKSNYITSGEAKPQAANKCSTSTMPANPRGGHAAAPMANRSVHGPSSPSPELIHRHDGPTQVNGASSSAAAVSGPARANGATAKAPSLIINTNVVTTHRPNGNAVPHGHTLSGGATWFKPDSEKPGPIAYLNRNSTADHDVNVHFVSSATSGPSVDNAKQDKVKGRAVQEPIGTRGANYSPTRPHVSFTTDVGPNANAPGGHYLQLDKVTGRQVHDTMLTLNEGFGWSNKVIASHCPSPINNERSTSLYVCMDDVRDAAAAFEQVETLDPNLKLDYVSQTVFAATRLESQSGTGELTAFYDGQVIFTCEFNQQLALDFHEQKAALEGYVGELAAEAGEVLAIDEMEGARGEIEYRVEYYKISSAKAVLQHITRENPKTVGAWKITTREMPDPAMQTTPPQRYVVATNGGIVTPQNGSNGNIVYQHISPTGRTAWAYDSNGKVVTYPTPNPVARVKPAGPSPSHTPGPAQIAGPSHMSVQSLTQSEPTPLFPEYMSNMLQQQMSRPMSWSAPPPQYGLVPYTGDSSLAPSCNKPRKQFTSDGPNKIYPHRITAGIDVRTSIMLRNIPHEMDYEHLKRLLDTTSWGRYDFSYLRIDFNNNKNVGYGFVNFIEALDILPFYDQYYGKPWMPAAKYNRRNGPRLADLSYATIQGLDCLIDKMRNSSVMEENHDFRPKMWYTEQTALVPKLIGTERPFPAANNFSKRDRSIANATQIGLYSSGSRQARNARGNGHQSQFDRGTTAQIQEEAYYNQQQTLPMLDLNGFSLPYMPNNIMLGAPPQAFPQFPDGHVYFQQPDRAPPRAGPYVQLSDPVINDMRQGYQAADSSQGPRGNNIYVPPPLRRQHHGPNNGSNSSMASGSAATHGQTQGYPVQGQNYGYQVQGQGYGYPIQGQGYGYPVQGQAHGCPSHGQALGYPVQGQAHGYPFQGQAQGHPSHGHGQGYPSQPMFQNPHQDSQSNEASHEMPAIPEETGDTRVVNTDDEHASFVPPERVYDENGTEYTRPKGKGKHREQRKPRNQPHR